jgi:hypothetical protein
MLKRILSVIAGAIVAVGVIFACEAASSALYPCAPGTNFKDPEAVKAIMAAMPMGAWLTVLAGYAIGCFAGGLVASLVSGRETPRASLLVGVIVTIGGIMNTVELPGQPVWIIVVSFLIYIPFALMGHLVVRKKRTVI